MFLFPLQLCSETFLILRKIQEDIINVYRCACKVPFLLSDFNETWILSTNFRKILRYPSGGWVVTRGRTDGWTDMKKLSFAFRNYANAPDHAPSVTKYNWTFNSFFYKKKNSLIVTKLDRVIQWRSETGVSGIWARFPADAWDFFLLRSVQTGSGTQYDPYSVCTRVLSPNIKRSGHEADHSRPFRTDVKNVSYWPTLYS